MNGCHWLPAYVKGYPEAEQYCDPPANHKQVSVQSETQRSYAVQPSQSYHEQFGLELQVLALSEAIAF